MMTLKCSVKKLITLISLIEIFKDKTFIINAVKLSG